MYKIVSSQYNYKYGNQIHAPYSIATLVSNITGMPRSTCIRKLEKLVKTKILVKNTNSKKYTYNTEVVNKNIKELNSRCLNIFGEFYYTLLRNLKVLK